MKKTFTITLILLGCMTAMGQTKPKQHVFYDTVKTVKERIDFSPDTIPVYFKELVIIENKPDTVKGLHLLYTQMMDGIYEHWVKGYVIWQTYLKQDNFTSSGLIFGTGGNYAISSLPQYYKDDYRESTQSYGIFLYADRKTKVTNKVIFSIKR